MLSKVVNKSVSLNNNQRLLTIFTVVCVYVCVSLSVCVHVHVCERQREIVRKRECWYLIGMEEKGFL